ncbi:MAG: hypothetical protein KDB00_13045, partial [Planctomycetales bacterium]|nr:hypothetical protein [Planctomycetales bacterium]
VPETEASFGDLASELRWPTPANRVSVDEPAVASLGSDALRRHRRHGTPYCLVLPPTSWSALAPSRHAMFRHGG